jgi:hypothetical protein
MRKFLINLIFTTQQQRIIFFALRNYKSPSDNKTIKEAIDELEDLFIDEV